MQNTSTKYVVSQVIVLKIVIFDWKYKFTLEIYKEYK
jgi:hypothetical protein